MNPSLQYSHHHQSGGIIQYTREQQQQQQSQQQTQCCGVYSQEKWKQQGMQQKERKLMLDRAASAHEYAQKLNNVSAMCIEIAKYDKAIESLGKALRLSEHHTTDQLLDRSEACNCQYCSLEGCIQHSENNSNLIELFDVSSNMNNNKNKSNDNKRNGRKRIAMDVEVDDNLVATLHCKPIRIPKRSIREGHTMGSTLFLIITFNLALAHHLKVLHKEMNNICTSSAAKTLLLNSTVQLYELANDWQYPSSPSHDGNEYYVTDSEDDDSFVDNSILSMEVDKNDESNSSQSARFQTILYNNLNHLNQMMNKNKDNDTRSRSLKRQLNDLISTVRRSLSPTTITTTANDCNYSHSVTTNCDLKFEYYNRNDQDEFYKEQGSRITA